MDISLSSKVTAVQRERESSPSGVTPAVPPLQRAQVDSGVQLRSGDKFNQEFGQGHTGSQSTAPLHQAAQGPAACGEHQEAPGPCPNHLPMHRKGLELTVAKAVLSCAVRWDRGLRCWWQQQ